MKRPVLFIDKPLKEHNKNWKQLNIEPIELQLRNKIGVSVTLDNLDKILSILLDAKQRNPRVLHVGSICI